MQPLIVVPANDIDAAGVAVDTELPRDWLKAQLADAEAEPTAVGKISGRVSRSGKADVVIRCKVSAQLELPCARCLKASPVDVKADLSLLLKPRAAAPRAASAGSTKARATKEKAKEKEYEFSDAEADLDEYDGERVVLDPWIREAILLELPSFPLCTEDCEGPGGLKPQGPQSAADHVDEEPPVHNPFEALRHLLPGNNQGLPSAETAGNGTRPAGADLRRISRAKKRAKPKIRSSAAVRGKK